jgi:hypothetical protein
MKAHEALLSIKSAEYKSSPHLLPWLARAHIMCHKPEAAWKLYLQMDGSKDAAASAALLRLIADECYGMGHFYHSAKAFQVCSECLKDCGTLARSRVAVMRLQPIESCLCNRRDAAASAAILRLITDECYATGQLIHGAEAFQMSDVLFHMQQHANSLRLIVHTCDGRVSATGPCNASVIGPSFALSRPHGQTVHI